MLFGTPSPEDIEIEIDGSSFTHWFDAELTRSIDSVDTVKFTSAFDPTNAKHRAIFKPFSYKPCVVKFAGEPVFTGTVVGVEPQASADSKTVTLTAYSTAGVLGDVTPHFSTPKEFKGLRLSQIAAALGAPFGLPAPIVLASEGAPFPVAKIDPTKRVLEFIIDLAKQRGLLVSSYEDGSLLLWKGAEMPGFPVALLNANAQPVTAVSASFSPQNYYSEINGIAPAKKGKPGSSFRAVNLLAPNGLNRPMTVEDGDSEPADMPLTVDARLGRMFGNAISFSVDVCTVLDHSGQLWAPNEFVRLIAPDVMVYTETTLLIRSVSCKWGPTERTATLELALTGAFDGGQPEALPWDE